MLEATKHGKLILMVIPTPFVASVMAQVSGAISEDQVSYPTLLFLFHTDMKSNDNKTTSQNIARPVDMGFMCLDCR